jgi:hypothetical protein
LALIAGLNFLPGTPIGDPLTTAAMTVAIVTFIALIVAAARLLKGWPRFLPRYALYAFYPLHLIALIGLRQLGL